jgi:ribosomal protein S17E
VLSFRESFFIVSLEELIEHKIKTVAEELIRKSHNELNQKFNSRQKQIREYVDG